MTARYCPRAIPTRIVYRIPRYSMRVLSGEMKDFEAQTLMLKLANDYDKLADRAEDRAARDAPGPSPRAKYT